MGSTILNSLKASSTTRNEVLHGLEFVIFSLMLSAILFGLVGFHYAFWSVATVFSVDLYMRKDICFSRLLLRFDNFSVSHRFVRCHWVGHARIG